MIRKAKVAVALGVAAALLLTGCSAGTNASSGGKTEITFLSWDTEQVMKPVIADFEKENPDITVKASYSPPVNDYIQALQTRILSGTAPDVFVIAAENRTNLLKNHAVLDLSDQPWVSEMPKFNQEAYGEDGKVYGLSVASWGAGVFFNKKLLKQVGYDTVPQDWDGFLTLCEKLKAAGITPFLESINGVPFFIQAFLGAHNEATGGTMDHEIFTGKSSFEKQWTPIVAQYDKLYSEGLASPDTAAITGDQVNTEFINQKVAMIPNGPWPIAQMRQSKDLDFGVTPIPALPGTKPYVAGAAGVGWAIGAKSKHVAASEKFLSYLASKRGVALYAKSSGSIIVTSNYTSTVDPAFEPLVPSIKAGDIYLANIGWERDQDVLAAEATAQFQSLVQGKISPQQLTQDLDKKLAATP